MVYIKVFIYITGIKTREKKFTNGASNKFIQTIRAPENTLKWTLRSEPLALQAETHHYERKKKKISII